MTKKTKVGVLFGGRSGEHEVSLVSAKGIMNAMDKEKYEIVPIGITKEGRWIASGDPMKALEAGTPEESVPARHRAGPAGTGRYPLRRRWSAGFGPGHG
jgi:D-alanine-D-alanine ligase